MKTFEFEPSHDSKVPQPTGFQAPEGYFDTFADRLMGHPALDKPVFTLYKKRPWAAAAVWLIGIGLLGWGWKASHQEAQQQVVTQYLEHQSQLSVDDVAPLLEPHHIQELERELLPSLSPQAVSEQLEQEDALNFELL